MREIRVGAVKLSPSDKAAVLKVLDSDQLSPGKVCEEFEQEFAKLHGANYGRFVNSGTDALRIALLALKEMHGWKDGDRIIVPALTFVATVNVILQAGLTPLFADVSMYDYNINPWNVERRAQDGDRIRAVMPVHLFGKPCDDKIFELAEKNGWKVIEDSCETAGVAKLRGDIACFSTYTCHLIAAGVGGLAITNDEKLSDLMWSYANHGRQRMGEFRFERIGYSARPTEMQAALGLEELKRLPGYLKRRREIAERLNVGLSDYCDLLLPVVRADEAHAYMMYPIVLKETSKVSKWMLCTYLNRRGIETREMVPLINQPCYDFLGIDVDQFAVASWINRCGFYMGCHPGMTDEDAGYVIETFKEFFEAKKEGAACFSAVEGLAGQQTASA